MPALESERERVRKREREREREREFTSSPTKFLPCWPMGKSSFANFKPRKIFNEWLNATYSKPKSFKEGKRPKFSRENVDRVVPSCTRSVVRIPSTAIAI